MNVKLLVQDLEFAYNSAPVLTGMCLEVPIGSLVSIVGPNGSGKSTLLKCIDRILTPRQGLVAIDGNDVFRLERMELAKQMSYVPQSSVRVFPHSVFDVILMGRRPHLGWTSSSEDEERVWDVIDLLGLEEIALAPFTELSGGQQQKALIARALVQETDVMLLDEPTSNLDIWHQLDVMTIVAGLVAEHGITALMAVHDLNMAARFSDRIIMMRDGIIHAAGNPWEVLTPGHIADVYGVEAHVQRQDDGTPLVVPMRQLYGNEGRPVYRRMHASPKGERTSSGL
jgi:iron complex transport system ATP-binding protein